MKVLLIGSGGREHALAWKIAQSPKVNTLFTIPGNPGTQKLGKNVPINVLNIEAITAFTRQNKIDLVVIGPEDPLALGLADKLRENNISVFGPSAYCAQIEASKAFAKAFMVRHGIPTAAYKTFESSDSALDYIKGLDRDYVIKVSGLAAGKGVFLPKSYSESEAILRSIFFNNRFGSSGDTVVIEEKLVGQEISVLAFSDGKTVMVMPPAQDHKRLFNGDLGPNTGGMGAFAPSPLATNKFKENMIAEVLQPVIEAFLDEGQPYIGVLYAGMILTDAGPKVLEFNCRLGDPETQVILPLLDSDLIDIITACIGGTLNDVVSEVRWKNGAAVCVVASSKGYPSAYDVGYQIKGVENTPEDILIFHAGTALSGDDLVTNGGRVLAVTATAADLKSARVLAYQGIQNIHFEGIHYRTDICEYVLD